MKRQPFLVGQVVAVGNTGGYAKILQKEVQYGIWTYRLSGDERYYTWFHERDFRSLTARECGRKR